MKTVYLVQNGEKRTLIYGEKPKPKPKKGEALIKVKACALNHLEVHMINGAYELPLDHIPGSDISGVIEVVNGESKLKVGQEVVVNPAISCKKCSRCKRGLSCENVTIVGRKDPGGYAEYVALPIEQLYAKPKNLSFVETAAFPLTFLTAYHMLIGRANLQKGETVFIWGASGGLGCAAIQIAMYMGAKTIAAVSSSEDAKKVKEIGADFVVNYKKDDILGRVNEFTGNEKVDVVFESVGTATWNMSLGMLRSYGRVVIAGTTSGAIVSQDLSNIYYYQHTIIGSRMGTKEEFEQILQLFLVGKLKPIIDKVFPLEKANEAVQRMQESKQMGKIVLEIG